jgi:pimeloyl-ACP methyl ester carboxylesterase
MKKFFKTFFGIIASLCACLVLFTLIVYAVNRSQTNKEIELLKENGYYNPVSVGGYSINVAEFGNENGHTFVAMAGLGMGEFPVSARKMTEGIEEENLVVFVDRAGYGLSGDTQSNMTIEYIVEDYRRALKNAGIEPPYILMPHSIGGIYADYWSSLYPDEIEGIAFIDGTVLSENAFYGEPDGEVTFWDKAEAFAYSLGYGRFFLRRENEYLGGKYTKEEQLMADALNLMTMDSVAPVSESVMEAENAAKAIKSIVTDDIPKVYICSAYGFEEVEDLIEYNDWFNGRILKNKLKMSVRKTVYEGNEEYFDKLLAEFEKRRNDLVYPYAEKTGNCEVILLPGDHRIYQHKPVRCMRAVMKIISLVEENTPNEKNGG